MCLQSFCPAQSEIGGTTAREPVGFTEGASSEWRVANKPSHSLFATRHSPFSAQIPPIWPVFRPVFLDLEGVPAISPRTWRGNSSRRLFLRGFKGSLLRSRKD